MDLAQYQIVLVNLDPTVGNEIKKTRPCVIISPNEMNRYLQTIVIAPITSSDKEYPTRVPVKTAFTKGWIVIDQLRSIDKNRIIKKIDKLSSKEINQVKAIIHETYVA